MPSPTVAQQMYSLTNVETENPNERTLEQYLQEYSHVSATLHWSPNRFQAQPKVLILTFEGPIWLEANKP